jgi:N-acetyl-1-D-myo-inositol-2-amino-2-deoxy-alpha-D-glucopyranoside deacetylase
MADNENEQLTFMAVHAHPDDEVFGTGVTLARLSSEGIRTVLVTATRGEVGEIVDPDLDEAGKEAISHKLGEVREEELKVAAEALGVRELRFLDFRDSGMVGTEDNNNPACFHQAKLDEAVRRLVKLIREFRPQVLATYEPFGGYGHPDHIQVHRVSVIAFTAAGDSRLYPELDLPAWQPQKLYYTVIPRSWFQQAAKEMRERGIDGPWNNSEMDTASWGSPDEMLTTRFDGRDFINQKLAAFRAHKTQIAPDNFMFVMPEDMLRDGLGVEFFFLAQSKLPQTTLPIEGYEEDLFAGLR